MSEVSATDAARNFARLLDAIEHDGTHFTIVRRGKAVAHLEPVRAGRGAAVKQLLRDARRDTAWRDDLVSLRACVEIQHRS